MTKYNSPDTLINSAHNKLLELFEHAQKTLLRNNNIANFGVLKMPRISLGQRGKIAGSAHLQKNLIKLNTLLFDQNKQYFLNEVIAHELSHILVYQLYGHTKPHGKEWQHLMRWLFDKTPQTKHSLDVSNIGIKQVAYECRCDKVYLSMIRHNKIVNGKRQYICKKCHQALKISG